MIINYKSFKVKNNKNKPIFHEITSEVKEIISSSNIKNGSVTVYSQHTTCSVIIQEESHDATADGTKFLLQDLLNIMEKIIPTCRKEGQYLHPGPEHIKYAKDLGEDKNWSLNTDAHLRSCIIGRSETIPILNSKLILGEFGRIFFIDFDSKRQRERTVNIQIVGE
jgi:secondary thiamine-phosphate synthase enzyme